MSINNRLDDNTRLLDNLIRMTQYSNTKLDKDGRTYLPSLKRGDIVLCEYTGLGAEYMDSHFAIVWAAPASDEIITTIPMTSKYKAESKGVFTIGKIPNFITDPSNPLVKDSWVYVSRLCPVSRKRITPWFQQSPTTGKPLLNSRGNKQQVQLSHFQLDRIKESIHLHYLNDGICLSEHIQNNINYKWICDISALSPQMFLHGYRKLDSTPHFHIIAPNQAVLIYYIAGSRYSMIFKPINDATFTSSPFRSNFKLIEYPSKKYDRRKKLIWSLFSNNITLVNEAKSIISLL